MKLKYNNLLMSFIERILSRSKGVVNASYKIINDFESSSEKECSKMDRENERIYSKLLTQAEKAHNAIKNSGLSMNLEVPIPPRPSNRDRYLLWKKRNVSKKVIEQTESVLFLEKKGYKYNEHYEAYQAIDLANEIKKSSGDSLEWIDTSKNFENVYNKNDQNIFRRRSMYKLNTNKTKNNSQNTQNTCHNYNESFSSAAPSAPPPPQEFNMNTQSNNIFNYDQQYQTRQVVKDNENRMVINRRSVGSPSSPNFGFEPNTLSSYKEENINIHHEPCLKPSNSINKNYIQNYSQIENENFLMNSTKPSAPPASFNIQQRTRIDSNDDSVHI